MSRKLDFWLKEWAQDVVRNMDRSGFSGINVIEKILRDPGVATGGSKHRVLWWPRNRRLAKIYRAMHRIPQRDQVCLVVEYGGIVKEDGNLYTKQEFSREVGIGVRKYNETVKKAKTKILEILGS